MECKGELSGTSAWPARLLHVESLTSFVRKPGNIYGDHIEPPYNAISYTWGRFVLKDGERPEIKSFPIKGISWEQHLPRISPSSFSTTDLHCAIKAAASTSPAYPAVKFVWLDIACINQNPGSDEMAQEIGRQASIFKRATNTVIWLTAINCNDFENLYTEFFAAFRDDGSSGLPLDPENASRSLQTILHVLQQLTKDPWFSSTWALQEGFLRPKAIFIFRDGISQRLLDFVRGGSNKLLSLDIWVQTWNGIMADIEGSKFATHPLVEVLKTRLSSLGIMDAVRNQWLLPPLSDIEYLDEQMGNPFKLLEALNHRRSTRAVDQIYGIMQVFNLKLGISAPGETRKDFTLPELQSQLAVELLFKYPIMSQIMIQNDKCSPYKAWAVNPSIMLPTESHLAWYHQASGGEIHVRASFTVETIADASWVCFQGPVSKITEFSTLRQDFAGAFGLTIILDSRWRKEAIDAGLDNGVPGSHFGRTMIWLCDSIEPITVLLLGHLSPPQDPEHVRFDYLKAEKWMEWQDWGVGLLIRQKAVDNGIRCATRLGTIIWDMKGPKFQKGIRDMPESARNFIRGRGKNWRDESGILGLI